ncbi:MAG: hypothetical protein L3J28_10020 [Candidatus Polarisedimenticolaceae bacterium]|nr:hypothetical protein [Candidatus Polarisedimenticolaceae bacterium]
MITRKLTANLSLILLTSFALLTLFPLLGLAEDTPFRIEFVSNYQSMNFKAQENLIKKSKAIMPGEIKKLLKDAQAKGVSLGKMMFMLDAANAMAYGYDSYHGRGKRLIKKVEKILKKEIKKEEARTAKLMKWKKEERFLGNFVMKTHDKEMQKEGVAPVLYPHWVHRIWYECSVCHQELFVMKRWRNQISHKQINEGKQCGTCHDGKIAFAADNKAKCDLCHVAGKPEAERLHNAKKLDHENIAKVAKRLGSVWNDDKLENGEIPVDEHGFIDWLKLKKAGIFEPLTSLNGDYTPEVRDNEILYISKSKIKNVLFSHNVHSSWIRCSSCHPAVFKENLKNNIKMVRMTKGQNCGLCHGKVSFTFADCDRCHSIPKGETVEGALLHKGPDKKKRK